MRNVLALLLAILCSATARAAQDPRSIVLVDQRGAPFTLAQLKGRPVAVTFVATRCSDVCPIANSAFYSLERRLAHDGIAAALVTITLDPSYDTPFVMSRLAREMGADPARWILASGSTQDVKALMHAFGVTAEDNQAGVPEVHSSFVYVLDRSGRVQRTFLLSTHVVDDVSRALKPT